MNFNYKKRKYMIKAFFMALNITNNEMFTLIFFQEYCRTKLCPIDAIEKLSKSFERGYIIFSCINKKGIT